MTYVPRGVVRVRTPALRVSNALTSQDSSSGRRLGNRSELLPASKYAGPAGVQTY